MKVSMGPGGHLNVLNGDGVRRYDLGGRQLPGIGLDEEYAFEQARSFVFGH
jgi:hypothetical protein